jgi:hypothetical protein
METKFTRRAIVQGGLIAGVLVPVIGFVGAQPAEAAALPLLDPNDATAKSLGFVSNAATVNAAKYPTYKTGQHCGSCVQFGGKPGDAAGPCNIFTGHSVPATGWCSAYVAKA